MSMQGRAQFTPGPLKAVQIMIENSPCTWAVQRKNIREQWGKPSIATYIDNEADARLFAAAPAMYAIIKDMREAFYVKGTRKALLEVMERSKNVLAQAEGRHHE